MEVPGVGYGIQWILLMHSLDFPFRRAVETERKKLRLTQDEVELDPFIKDWFHYI